MASDLRLVARQLDGTTPSPVAWDHVRAISVGMVMMAPVGCGGQGRRRRRGRAVVVPVSRPGFCRRAVGLAVEDELVGGGLEPVDGGLGEERVGHLAEPLDRLAVRGDDGGRRRGGVRRSSS